MNYFADLLDVFWMEGPAVPRHAGDDGWRDLDVFSQPHERQSAPCRKRGIIRGAYLLRRRPLDRIVGFGQSVDQALERQHVTPRWDR
jgi:hypothetical protein